MGTELEQTHQLAWAAKVSAAHRRSGEVGGHLAVSLPTRGALRAGSLRGCSLAAAWDVKGSGRVFARFLGTESILIALAPHGAQLNEPPARNCPASPEG